jgi:hypothetical protein
MIHREFAERRKTLAKIVKNAGGGGTYGAD